MRTLLTFVIVILSVQLFAQGIIKGNVTNINGDAIPYSTIFVKEISLGTTTNSNGEYKIQLSPGSYNVEFRSMGFIPKNIMFRIDTSTQIQNIILEDQVFQLHEVRVYASGEDPAYPIMRRAISMAPYYLNQVKNYHAEVYIKGTAKLEKVPKILKKSFHVGADDQMLKEGELFIGENISEINFEAPNIYKQKIISSNMSMMEEKGQTFDMGLLTLSAYEPSMDNLIMPLSPQAFSFYNFKFIGYTMDGEYMIDKIKITPKRKSKQLFSGYVYIVDGLWCLHSLDIETEQFYGTLDMKVQFGELSERVWLPISHNITIRGKIMGIKGWANYTSSLKYKTVIINEGLEIPPLLSEFITEQKKEEEMVAVQKTKRQQKIETIMQKEEMSNRDAIVLAKLMDKEAKELRKDSKGKKPLEIPQTYHVDKDSVISQPLEQWVSLRPNPLTVEEQKSYFKNDSLAQIKSEKKDTTTTKGKPGKKVFKGIVSGHQFKWQGDSIRLNYKGLVSLDLLSFNAVEGWKYRQEVEFNEKLKNHRELKSIAWVGYSFNRQAFQWNIYSRFQYAPLHPAYLNFSAGNNITDYMGSSGISPFINSVSSLFFKENYARYLQQKYFRIENTKEISNGLDLKVGFDYYNRDALQNSTNFSFFNKQEDYHLNEIQLFDGNTAGANEDISSIFNLSLRYIPRRHYRIRDGRKYPDRSSWPSFMLSYKKGVSNVFGSSSDWDYIGLRIEQGIKTGVSSYLNYEIRGGIFLNTKNISFADYANLKTAPLPINMKSDIYRFHLLPYYSYNTNSNFIEAHCNYSNPYILLKYLPWLSERMWKENLNLSYLSLPDYRNYIETGYFLSEVMFLGDIGVFAGFENGKYKQVAIRATLKF